jgi:hypothetical protein
MINSRYQFQAIFIPPFLKWVKREDKWLKFSELNEPGCKGYLYVIGGFYGQNLVYANERYDVAKDSWEQIPSLYQPAHNMSLLSFKKRFIYVFGGQAPVVEMDVSDYI